MKRLKSTLPFLVAIALSYIYPFDFAKRECPLTYPFFNMTQDLCWNKLLWIARLHDVTICHKDVHKFWFIQILIFATRLLLVWVLFKFWWWFTVLERTEILCSRWKYSMVFSWYCSLQFWQISAMPWSLKRWVMFRKARPWHLKEDKIWLKRLKPQVC